MAIQLFCGLPGSGKSYGVVENVILPALKEGRAVVSNIPLNLDVLEFDIPGAQQLVTQYRNEDVTGEFLMGLPGGAVVIIDECWRFWPSGLTANKIDKQHKEFFAEHRHKVGESGLTQEIVLVTQSPSQIAKVIRDLVDQTVISRKNTAVGLDKTYNMDIYSGCASSLERPGTAIMSGFGRYKPEVYRYYRSHTKAADNSLPAIEKRADNRGRFWNHPYFRYVVPFFFLASIWAVPTLVGFFRGDTIKDKVKSPEPVQAPVKPVVPQTVPRVDPGTVESKTWRVVGYATAGSSPLVYVQHVRTRKFRRLTVRDCTFGLDGPECTISGELVTKNTGWSERTVVGQAVRGAKDTVMAFGSDGDAEPGRTK